MRGNFENHVCHEKNIPKKCTIPNIIFINKRMNIKKILKNL